jgi:SPP1 family predicted phage head-tail adaptor
MLKEGRLRHRITLQRPGMDQDPDTGDVVPGWEDVAEVWAEIAPLSVREYLAADAKQSEVTTRITIRYRDGITPDLRIYHAGKDKYYDIEGILPDPDSGLEYLTLACSEGVRHVPAPETFFVLYHGDYVTYNGDKVTYHP